MPKINRQQGFTLVEMAIVLVIIGLLLGGILKGQELITSAPRPQHRGSKQRRAGCLLWLHRPLPSGPG